MREQGNGAFELVRFRRKPGSADVSDPGGADDPQQGDPDQRQRQTVPTWLTRSGGVMAPAGSCIPEDRDAKPAKSAPWRTIAAAGWDLESDEEGIREHSRTEYGR